MSAFVYYTPTRVIFEKGAQLQAGKQLKAFGAKKVLVHYGSDRLVKSGFIKTVTDTIQAEGIGYTLLGGAVPNPRLSKAQEGIELSRKEGVDFILAVGGGSVIDSAKCIALGLCYDGNVWDFFERTAVPENATPVGTILTLPAAGSEMSNGLVITNENGNLKRGFTSELCLAKFTLMNPELTLSLPTSETVNGIVDIMMHTMERYFHPMEDMDITDRIAEGLLLSMMDSARILYKDPQNMPARESVMWAGSLAHNSLTGCGSGGGDWSTHQMEHELSGMFDVAHGAGLSTIWPTWARYAIESNPHRFAKFAHRVMNIADSGNELSDGMAGIAAIEDFFSSIGSPINYSQLLGRRATAEEIEDMAEKSTFFGKRSLGSVRVLEKSDIIKIYSNIS